MDVRVPGDKSISQRALILGALATGETRIRGLSTAGDPRSTAAVLRQLGVFVSSLSGDEVVVTGVGLNGLAARDARLDCGNSGTCARLMLGVLAGHAGSDATISGDASLRDRPMERVTDPLARVGARFEWQGSVGRLPVRVAGGSLEPLEHRSPVASAQVKSALLLAGLVSGSRATVVEPARSRDHTERMLSAQGATVRSRPDPAGWRVELDPPSALEPLDLDVPGDASAAAFLLVLGALGGGGARLSVEQCGLNPTRTGFLSVLERMGADVEAAPVHDQRAVDPVGRVTVRPSTLDATTIGGDELPHVIDEVPILAVAAARARGRTRIRGASELRVKETDRIRAIVENLRSLGIEALEHPDGLEIEGNDRPLVGRVRAFGDHRIAMAFGVLGALPGNRVEVDEPAAADVSFPGFWDLLARAGAR